MIEKDIYNLHFCDVCGMEIDLDQIYYCNGMQLCYCCHNNCSCEGCKDE